MSNALDGVSLEYADDMQVIKTAKKHPKGAVKKMLREERKISNMNDLQIWGYQVYRHRVLLTGIVIGVLLPYGIHSGLIWLASTIK